MARFKIVTAVLLVAAAIAACASPFGAQPLDQAATAVVQTLSAVSPAAPQPSPLPTQQPTSSPVPEVLPRSLYYLNHVEAGLTQVYRLAKDGKTVQQITFEPADVGDFDVSPVDGSVAYISNNQLILVDQNGAGRRILVDGGAVDPNVRFLNNVSSPVWSLDGKTIAFGYGGLDFYSLANGSYDKVIENKIDNLSSAFPMPLELYAPARYSPDGTKLLVSIGFYEGGAFAVYRAEDSSLTRFSRSDGSMVCCELRWVPDGSGLYAASAAIGMVDSGLSYLDASTGKVTILLPGSAPDGTYNFAAGPQVGRDGKLYFFFNNLPQIPTTSHTPLFLVRSDTDGVTGRTQLKKDAFNYINEVLWAPDASLAIVAGGPTDDVAAGGPTEIVYPDDRPDIKLIDFAQGLHWGP